MVCGELTLTDHSPRFLSILSYTTHMAHRLLLLSTRSIVARTLPMDLIYRCKTCIENKRYTPLAIELRSPGSIGSGICVYTPLLHQERRRQYTTNDLYISKSDKSESEQCLPCQLIYINMSVIPLRGRPATPQRSSTAMRPPDIVQTWLVSYLQFRRTSSKQPIIMLHAKYIAKGTMLLFLSSARRSPEGCNTLGNTITGALHTYH